MAWVRDIDSFYNFIGYVINRAPNTFPVEDYLVPSEQMNLDRAFDELRHGLEFVDPEVADNEKKSQLNALLDESLSAYRAGEEIKGAHFLSDFESLIFKS